jgi:gliding motility-associated lipoprotein GldH
MSLKNSILFILTCFILFSCDKKRIFDQYKSVGNAWNKDTIATFTFEQNDTIQPYNLFVNIMNNDAYQFSNLFLIVALEQPSGFTKVDTLEYQMTNPDGTLLGDGFTDIKESKLFYKEKMKFPQKGNYKVSIQQAVRQTGKIPGVIALEGVTEVGFRIESLQ